MVGWGGIIDKNTNNYCMSGNIIFVHQIIVSHTTHDVIGVFLFSQSAPVKHNQEINAHKPLRTSRISLRKCVYLVILNQQTYNMFSLLNLHFMLCSSDLGILCMCSAKDSRLFFICITHKSTRLENLFTWTATCLFS